MFVCAPRKMQRSNLLRILFLPLATFQLVTGQFIQPKAGDVLTFGEPYTIKWKPTGSGKVNLTIVCESNPAPQIGTAIATSVLGSLESDPGNFVWVPDKQSTEGLATDVGGVEYCTISVNEESGSSLTSGKFKTKEASSTPPQGGQGSPTPDPPAPPPPGGGGEPSASGNQEKTSTRKSSQTPTRAPPANSPTTTTARPAVSSDSQSTSDKITTAESTGQETTFQTPPLESESSGNTDKTSPTDNPVSSGALPSPSASESSSEPSSGSSSGPPSGPSKSKKIPVAAIIGAVLGAIIVLLCIFIAVFGWRRGWFRQKHEEQPQPQPPQPYENLAFVGVETTAGKATQVGFHEVEETAAHPVPPYPAYELDAGGNQVFVELPGDGVVNNTEERARMFQETSLGRTDSYGGIRRVENAVYRPEGTNNRTETVFGTLEEAQRRQIQ